MKDIFKRFLENKDRLIDKLDLTDEQKGQLKTFFNSHPNFENKIDWNKKDLKWEDFQEVLKLEGNTKSSQKKYGLSGKAQIEDLVEGKDYDVILEEPQFCIYYPLTFKGSETLAKPTTPPLEVTGKWCIAGKNYSPGTRDQHWERYTEEKDIDFFFLFMEHRKYAIARYADNHIQIFDQTDNQVNEIWDYSERYSKMHINMDWLKKLMAKQPHKLQKEKLNRHIYAISESGVKTLKRVNPMCKELEVPEDVSVIGERAAENYTALQKIHIPANVTEIGGKSFSNCSYVQEIIIDMNGPIRFFSSNWSDKIFSKTTGEVTINIVDGDCADFETDTGPDLFFGETAAFSGANITSLRINCPDNKSYTVPYGCFRDCKQLKTVILNNCYFVDGEAFLGCENLETVIINSEKTGLAIESFGGCTKLARFQFSPSCHVDYIGSGAFERCRSLPYLQINSCDDIGSGVFSDCWKLQQLVLPANLRSLGDFENEEESMDSLFDDLYPMNQRAFNITFMGTKDRWEQLLTRIKRANPEEYKFLIDHTNCRAVTPEQGKKPKQQVK